MAGTQFPISACVTRNFLNRPEQMLNILLNRREETG
jgi:hypothetical protein